MKLNKSHVQVFMTIIICLSILNSSDAQTTMDVSGEITKDTTWSADLVRVNGDIFVRDSITLSIAPGTTVEFQGHYVMNVCGTLLAIGLPEEMILFTAENTLTGWKGIRLNNTHFYEGLCPGAMYNNDTTVLDYCKIQYVVDDVPLYIRIFTRCKILNSTFSNNKSNTGAGVIFSYQGGGVIEGCTFSNNTAPGLSGGALYLGGSDAPYIIRNNVFSNNTSKNGGAISIYNSDVLIENNIFLNNQVTGDGGAIYMTNSDRVIIQNNLLANNTAARGGAIFHQGSNPKILNNTIVNNRSVADGGGIYFAGNSDCGYYSNILWGNRDNQGFNQVFIEDDRSDPLFMRCDIQGDSSGFSLSEGVGYEGSFEENINADPSFLDPSSTAGAGFGSLSDDWSIDINSPCINKGISELQDVDLPEFDLGNTRRITFGEIDIGAYEYYDDEMIVSGPYSQDVTWAADTVKVTGDITINSGYTLWILPQVYVQFLGSYKIDIKGRILARGIAGFPIIFSIPDSTGISVDSIQVGWKGIHFDNTMVSNKKSEIDHVIIEYCENMCTGAIYVNNFSKILIKNSIFRYNQVWGLSIGCGGPGIHCQDAEVTILDCIFENNRSEYYAGAIYANNSDIQIENSTIAYNKAYSGGGITLINRSSLIMNSTVITNNIATGNIYYSDGGALYVAENSSLKIINSVISNNYALGSGGVMQSSSCKGYILNSTLVNNYVKANYGAIFLAGFDNEWIITNSIIWGNRSEIPSSQLRGTGAEVTFTNIENGYPSSDGSNIDTDPFFSDPSDSAGSEFDGLQADWSLTDFSPCINAGTKDIISIPLPETDLAGQNRINQHTPDMGAFEHQGGPPVINSQPDNLIACEGEEVTLAVEITDTAVFQWQKDGMDLPGANSPVFSFNSITTGDQGSYRCVIWNAYDTVNTTQANIVVYAIPVFQGDWQTTWAEINEEIELRTYAYGTSLNYQWQKDGTDLPGENLPGLIFTPAGYEDEGIYRCIASNSCGSDTMKSVPVYLAPQICMVTVDPATGNNLVVWEKNSIAPISYYKIYRESQYAGIYDPLATIPYDDLSVLMDSTADPVKRAYLYKITAVDTAGHETDIDLCRMHKTIHLLVTTNPETKSTQLDWDRYVGFEYGRYEIFRSDTTINFTSLDIMSSSISTYTDTYSEDGIRYYRVAAIRPDPCYPSGTASRKADAGPYSHSMSNLEDNRLQTFIRELPVRGLSIYPNPFSEYAMIHFDNPEGYPYTLYLMNLAGKVLRIVSDITSSQYEVAKSDLDPGIYFVELRGTRIFTGKLVIE